MISSAISYRGREPYIFFIFYREDAPIVYPIIERLTLEGYRICYNDGSVKERKDVLKQLLESSVCVTALSEAASNDHDFREDMSFALKAKNGFSLLLAEFPLRPSLKLYLESSRYINAFDCTDDERIYKRFFEEKSFDICREAGVHPDYRQLTEWRERAKEYIRQRSTTISDYYGEESVYIRNWFGNLSKDTDKSVEEELHKKEEAELRRKEEEEFRKKEEEELRRKEEEEFCKKEEEELRRKEEEELRKREEEELRRKEEEELRKREEEELRRKEEEEFRKKEEEELHRKEEEERLRKEHTLPVKVHEPEPEDEREKTFPGDGDGETIIERRKTAALLIRIKTGKKYRIDRIENRIGRSSGQVNIKVEGNQGISRVHAQIFQLNGNFKLQDLGSSYGTDLNGRALNKDEVVELPQTALIRMADEEFVFLSGEDAEQAEKEEKLSILRAVESGEVRLLKKETLPLDRSHSWRGGALKSKSISRAQHAELFWKNGDCYVRALKSTNGTYFNGHRMEEQEEQLLHSGDKISLGTTEDLDFLEINIKEG